MNLTRERAIPDNFDQIDHDLVKVFVYYIIKKLLLFISYDYIMILFLVVQVTLVDFFLCEHEPGWTMEQQLEQQQALDDESLPSSGFEEAVVAPHLPGHVVGEALVGVGADAAGDWRGQLVEG